jgi:tRNA A-37 threonylcarbamoyl transferase component Bud32
MTNPQDAFTPPVTAGVETNGGDPTTPPSSSPASSPDEGRFPVGIVLAGRYRILGLLGKGGMGEVYKAFDLILNQNVALKFLAVKQYGESALARFRNEVRVARQVSHPNVCRVYDLGMVEGLHFLSMEYIDGEDLASLLRRIGRLPQDKAIEFTRKICAGLAAAHDRGVLHRDLKPANIMIDGRGHVRITDFGLAALEAEIPLSDLRSGTPAYMSPEQKAGREVTPRSDIYSLGLILHEMFTGKPRRETQSAPTEIIKDLDPMIERLIIRCLEEEPKRRPQTAMAVAMALPGADPIAAALAAGETPSPEMVAASEKEGFSAKTAALCFVAIIVCFLIGLYFSERISFLAQTPMPLPPEALADRAQQFLKSVGYTDPPSDVASGFFCCDYSNEDKLKPLEPAQRAEILRSHQPAVVRFWYRQHTKGFPEGDGRFARPTEMSPPNFEPGMILVNLDATGRLLRLQVQPWETEIVDPQGNWLTLFSAAGLDFARFTSVPTDAIPPMDVDAQFEWRGSYADGRPEIVTVSGASWRGRPVLFQVQDIRGRDTESADSAVLLAGISALVLGAVMLFLAWHNWRSGRIDNRGAVRLAATVFILSIVTGFGIRSFSAPVFSWVLYLGIEPYARRYWPDSLISWSRFSHGRIRNPLVASHILISIVFAAAFSYLLFPQLRLLSPYTHSFIMDDGLSAMGSVVFLGRAMNSGITAALIYLAILVLGRMVFRKRLAADLVAAFTFNGITFIALWTGDLQDRILLAVLFLVPSLTWIPLMRRFGFLTILFTWVAQMFNQAIPLKATGWMASQLIALHLIPIAVAAWALWVIASSESGNQTHL